MVAIGFIIPVLLQALGQGPVRSGLAAAGPVLESFPIFATAL